MMTKNLAQIWAEMLAALSASFEGRSWKIWLDAAHPRTLEENTLPWMYPTISPKTPFRKNTCPSWKKAFPRSAENP